LWELDDATLRFRSEHYDIGKQFMAYMAEISKNNKRERQLMDGGGAYNGGLLRINTMGIVTYYRSEWQNKNTLTLGISGGSHVLFLMVYVRAFCVWYGIPSPL
jgi:hypothetical protein